MDSIRKEFKPQTLLVRNTEDNILSNKEKVLQRWYEYEQHYVLQDGTASDSGEGWTMCVKAAGSPKDIDIERK